MTTDTKLQVNSLDGLLNQLLPIWAAQIQSSRSITDESITHLSKLFYGLSQRIQSTVELKSQNQNIVSLIRLFRESQSQQQKIMLTSLEDRKALKESILNLTQSYSSNSESISNINDVILKASELSKSSEAKDMELFSQYEHLISHMEEKLNSFTRELDNQTEMLNVQAEHIKKDISDVLVTLQFQDRVNQMLAVVNNDLNKLDTAIRESSSEINTENWITDFAKTYVMREQHELHKQVTGNTSSLGNTEFSSDEITFF